MLEAKLKITEHDLNVALQRAERAESELQNSTFENQHMDNDFATEHEVIMRKKPFNTPQTLPPPPPPPVPNLNFGTNKTEIKVKAQARAVAEMAAMLDIKPANNSPAKSKTESGGIYERYMKLLFYSFL